MIKIIEITNNPNPNIKNIEIFIRYFFFNTTAKTIMIRITITGIANTPKIIINSPAPNPNNVVFQLSMGLLFWFGRKFRLVFHMKMNAGADAVEQEVEVLIHRSLQVFQY